MNIYKNLTIVGTSHISEESIREVEKVILETKPEIVALELDRRRFEHLINGKKTKLRLRDIGNIGIKGFIFNLIGAFIENKLGKLVNVKPGSEMKKATEIAKLVNARIALVDQDIGVTLSRLSKEITYKEKFRFLWDLIKGIFVRQKINFDLRKVPSKELINKLVKQLKGRYPNLYKVLIHERNIHIGRMLYMLRNYRVVAVIGAGHEDEVINEIKKLESFERKVSSE